MTASLKTAVKAPSMENGLGYYVILPDILAIDVDNGQGWCFEVKDETRSRSKMRSMTLGKTERYGGGYSGPVWMLQTRNALGYLNFSNAFECPCVIAIKSTNGWRVGFFTRQFKSRVDYNSETVAQSWSDSRGKIPIMFERLEELEPFLRSIRSKQRKEWLL